MDSADVAANKEHRAKKSGAKFDKRRETTLRKRAEEDGAAPSTKQKDHRAFGVAKFGRVHKTQQRNLDRSHRKDHVPLVDRTPVVPPPVIVVVMGPPGSGKSSLIKSLVKNYTRHSLPEVRGPISVVTGKHRRVTFIEVPNDLNSMIDAAKIADLVLLTVDGSFGFEMETFEFLNILATHGMPKVMGVLTHLDGFREAKQLRRTKKDLKQRFWVELYQGAKLFYLSGVTHGHYPKAEIHNLALYISRMKFRPLTWRNTHSYIVVDRVEDVTDPALVQRDAVADRSVAMFGFVRGTHLKPGTGITIPGAGDFIISDVSALPDPIPLPERDPEKRKANRSLSTKETLLYAPHADIGSSIRMDKDAVYISVPHAHFTRPGQLSGKGGVEALLPGAAASGDSPDESTAADADRSRRRRSGHVSIRTADGVTLVQSLQDATTGIDDKLDRSRFSLFAARGGAAGAAGAAGAPAGGSGGDDEGSSSSSNSDGDSDSGSDSDDSSSTASSARGSSSRLLPLGMPDASRTGALSDGRVRRRAVFAATGHAARPDPDADRESDSNTDSDDDSSNHSDAEGGDVRPSKRPRAGSHPPPDSDDDSASSSGAEEGEGAEEADGTTEEDGEEKEEEEEGLQWKSSLVERATSALRSRLLRAPDLMDAVYGTDGEAAALPVDADGNDHDDGDTFFRLKGRDAGSDAPAASSSRRPGSLLLTDHNAPDSSCMPSAAASVGDSGRWLDAANRERVLRQRFVTGAASAAAEEVTAAADGADSDGASDSGSSMPSGAPDEDEDVYGEFEDLEAPAAGGASTAAATAVPPTPLDIAATRAAAAADKALQKIQFDADYDDDANDDGAAKKTGRSKRAEAEAAAAAEDAAQSAEAAAASARHEAQLRMNESEWAGVPDALRYQLTGFPPGAYVRILVRAMPAEFARAAAAHPELPVVVGGFATGEDSLSFLRLRFKRHRWHPRILKTNDPLIFSMGWRRFQSLPLFAHQDDNERFRYLKYTPEHMHCYATIYGPYTPPNTGLVAFQTLAADTAAFRVVGSGAVLEGDAAGGGMRVSKKLKLVGYPLKIFKKTAFIRGMFNSALEVAKMEGASIRTVSGIRGCIKKAVKEGPPGTFRATFEDRVLMSDIAFCRAWVAVPPTPLYNPITSLLDTAPQTVAAAVPAAADAAADAAAAAAPAAPSSGGGAPLLLMKTHKQLRRERGVGVVPMADSLYRPIERAPRRFNAFHIPASLQAALPFASKPKQQAARPDGGARGGGGAYAARRAVVMDRSEKEAYSLLQQVFTLRNAKDAKAREAEAAHAAKRAAALEKDDAAKRAATKGARKRKYAEMAQREAAGAAKSAVGLRLGAGSSS